MFTTQSKSFGRWCEFVSQQRELKSKATVVVARWRHLEVSSCFGRWCEYVSEVQAMRRAADRFMFTAQSKSFGR